MSKLIKLKAVVFILALLSFSIFAATPNGYFPFFENSQYELALDHNGNGIFQSKANSTVFINLAMQGSVIALYFTDGSHVIVDAEMKTITTVDKPDRNGVRKRLTYSETSFGLAWQNWKITNVNKSLLEEFVRFSHLVAGNKNLILNSTFPNSMNQAIDLNLTEYLARETLSSNTTVPQACKEKQDKAINGYLGKKSYLGCVSNELIDTGVSGIIMIGACYWTGPVGCNIARAEYVNEGRKLLNQHFACEAAKTLADQELIQCLVDTDSNGNGGNGGRDIGTIAPRVNAPILHCAEWVSLKNTTLGDIDFCERWESLP